VHIAASPQSCEYATLSTAQIFMLDAESRSTANNAGWREDRQWARALDHGWNLGEAKQVCSSFTNAAGIACSATACGLQSLPQRSTWS